MDLKLVFAVLKVMLYTRRKGKKLCLQKSYRNNKLALETLYGGQFTITTQLIKTSLSKKFIITEKNVYFFADMVLHSILAKHHGHE